MENSHQQLQYHFFPCQRMLSVKSFHEIWPGGSSQDSQTPNLKRYFSIIGDRYFIHTCHHITLLQNITLCSCKGTSYILQNTATQNIHHFHTLAKAYIPKTSQFEGNHTKPLYNFCATIYLTRIAAQRSLTFHIN